MLREIVGNLKPGGFACYKKVAFRADPRVIIETAESNAEFRSAIGTVYNRRTTDAAKPAMKSRRGLEVFN